MIPPATIAAALRAAAPFIGGPTFDILCQSIALSMVDWLPTGVTFVGVTTGIVGVGVVSGTLQFVSTPPVVLAAMSFTGPTSPMLAEVLSAGLNAGLVNLTYMGVSAGVGQGIDVSLAGVANVPALAGILRTVHTQLCAALGGSGSWTPTFYEGIAAGIGAVVSTGVTVPGQGKVAPAGPLGPSSSVGTSTSVPV